MVSINNRYGMIASLPKLQQALGANNGATTKSARDNLATNKTTNLDPRAINEKLADAGIKNAIFKLRNRRFGQAQDGPGDRRWPCQSRWRPRRGH